MGRVRVKREDVLRKRKGRVVEVCSVPFLLGRVAKTGGTCCENKSDNDIIIRSSGTDSDGDRVVKPESYIPDCVSLVCILAFY